MVLDQEGPLATYAASCRRQLIPMDSSRGSSPEAGWTMNDGGALASLCADGQAGLALAEQIRKRCCSGNDDEHSGLLVPVCSPSQRAQSIARAIGETCIGALNTRWRVAASVPHAKQHVPEDCVKAALEIVAPLLESKTHAAIPLVLLAAGGSSAVGLAKAVKANLPTPQQQRVHIASVTTTFAGSECTNIVGYMRNGQKHVVRNDILRPTMRVYDGSLFATLPFDLGITSAFNAFAHAIGCLSAPGRTARAETLEAE
eukprot:COSAG02_NODE_19347_length_886_cov_1.233799_1_plen_257_part_01